MRLVQEHLTITDPNEMGGSLERPLVEIPLRVLLVVSALRSVAKRRNRRTCAKALRAAPVQVIPSSTSKGRQFSSSGGYSTSASYSMEKTCV